MKMKLKHRGGRKQKTQKDETLIEKNSDLRWKMCKIQFLSSFE